jgi:hypothetical protein
MHKVAIAANSVEVGRNCLGFRFALPSSLKVHKSSIYIYVGVAVSQAFNQKVVRPGVAKEQTRVEDLVPACTEFPGLPVDGY